MDLRSFMRCMYDAEEKVGDAVRVLTSRMYNNLAYNAADSDSIAAFYAPEAVSAARCPLWHASPPPAALPAPACPHITPHR